MPDLQITQIDPTTGIVTLGLGISPPLLTGLDLLVQLVTLTFLKDPGGRDVIQPTAGSGLRAAMGQYNITSGNNDITQVNLLMIQQTKVVEQQILQNQEGTTSDATERLNSLQVLDVGFDPQSDEALLRVQIINEAGDVTDVIV